jgi:hypothetical protein
MILFNKENTVDKGNLRDIDDMISESDYKAMETLSKIKRRLQTLFDKKKLLAEMLQVIDSSECIEFSSDRSRKFIDVDKPIFKLKFIVSKAVELHSKELGFNPEVENTEKEIVDFRMNVIYNEIIKPFSSLMSSALKNMDTNLLETIPKEIELVDFLISSIFQVKTELGDNIAPICYVEYTI